MHGSTATVKKLFLLLGDVVLLFVALAAMLRIRYSADQFHEQWQLHFSPFLFIFGLFIVILVVNGLYDIQKAKNNVHFYRQFFEALIAATALAVAFFYIVPAWSITPKTNLLIFIGLFGALFTLWRMGFNEFVAPRLLRRRLLFIGRTPEAEELITLFKNDAQLGYLPVALVELSEKAGAPIEGVEMYRSLTHIRAIVTAYEIDTVVLGIDIHKQNELTQELYELIFWQLDIVTISRLFEHITGRVPLSTLSESWFLENLHAGNRKLYDAFRIAFDLVFASIILVATAVLTPFVALAIKATSPGPVFFSQTRVGKNGKPIKIHKFRTMKALAADGSAETVAPQMTQMQDARVTGIGAFLRKMRIDELPQAWNILKGEMALIGPRPERPEFVEQIEGDMPFFTVRHIVRPGLTGWAQINFPYAKTLEELLIKLQYDLYYIKNRSLMIDVAIFLKTINVIVRRKGL